MVAKKSKKVRKFASLNLKKYSSYPRKATVLIILILEVYENFFHSKIVFRRPVESILNNLKIFSRSELCKDEPCYTSLGDRKYKKIVNHLETVSLIETIKLDRDGWPLKRD